jgi:tetratricopeptide (TPR) repeat protein
LANALRYQGDLETALKTIRNARKIADIASYPTQTTRLFNQFGYLLQEGLILGESDSVNLDRPAEAVEALQKAMDLTEEASSKDASDSASRSRLGTAVLELGGVLRDRDPRRALAVYDAGIHRLEEVGGRREARRDRAVLLAKSSYPLRRLHQPSESLARINSAVAILKDTKEYPAEQVRLGSHVYEVSCALADHYAEAGDPRVALQMYQQLLDRVLPTKPDPLGDLKDAPQISRIYANLAALYRRSGDAASAKAMNTRRAELWHHWRLTLPQNAFVRRQLDAVEEAIKGSDRSSAPSFLGLD